MGQQLSPATLPTTASLQSDELIALSFPENVELKVLVEYVSERLRINILYDEQAIAQRVTVKAPTKVPASSLIGLLESSLKIKGLVLIDADQPGWKRIVPVAALPATARPSTQPIDAAPGGRVDAVTQIFRLAHSDPAKADAVIKPFLSQPGGNSLAVSEAKLLIVTDFVSNIRRITELVRLIDQRQPTSELQFVPVKHLAAESLSQQIAQVLASQAKSQGAVTAASAESLEITQDTRTNQLIVMGSRGRIEEALKLAAALDVPLDLETRTYRFQAASPERVDRLARELAGAAESQRRYHSVVDKESNVLIVTTTPAIHARMTSLKQELDVAIAQTPSPIRFYKLANTTAAAVLQTIRNIEGGNSGPYFPAADLDSAVPPSPPLTTTSAIPGANLPPPPAGQPPPPPPIFHQPDQQRDTPSTQPATVQSLRTENAIVTADPNTNTIIVVADPQTQRVYEQLIKTLDKRRPQVLIEATIVTLDTSNNFTLGVEIAAKWGNDNQAIVFSSFGLSTVGEGDDLGRLALTPGLGFNGALISSDVADIVVRALESNGRARVLSAPRILVNDNATGTLQSVAESPFVSTNASNTVATTSFGGYASAGTVINVTPHISEGDHLQLKYIVQLNSFTGQGTTGSPPPRQTDSVQSEVTIPDGSTIIVGGLNRTNFSETKDAVPILGRIPVLEYLFSNRTTMSSTTTLFVFLRPVILRDDQFEDLKYYSDRDAQVAGLAGDFPISVPMLMN